ncbi:anti-sigma regulatory factor (Ser/Thr protein kinase) [Catenuloplanes nepalensis]|uniref:Anti-sigma regulatory factor (Ser/Thr protein kinase) n=1 Tax=Catenuloplanes nepalensis TaxID=587533 RepID=A0ABT9MW52_9ACTN|nr:anti-sigma factor RsbA family regulatory protein [Catenuloplanes nepalensis]MDP9795674.1 anti-sigma regulatory factor (Ser/Thr protein kinase) [Catenuloplanes nepalensis]
MDSPAISFRPARTGAAAGHRGFFHEAAFHSSPTELLAIVLPFLLAGVAAGEPTVVVFGDERAALIRDALPADAKVAFLPAATLYSRPASSIRTFRSMLARHFGAGAGQIRVAGEVPSSTFGPAWESWARYESAINHALDDFPLWSMCVYDRLRTPAHVLADVTRTHPHAAAPGGHHLAHPAYLPPASFLPMARARPHTGEPLPAPHTELHDPSPAEARRAVRAADGGRLPADTLDDLAVAVSETVTNAHRHGTPPIVVRVWALPDRTTVSVTDAGRGPADPFAGLLPAGDGARGGLGLWVTHQCCDAVTERHGPDGYTVTMTMNAARPPSHR